MLVYFHRQSAEIQTDEARDEAVIYTLYPEAGLLSCYINAASITFSSPPFLLVSTDIFFFFSQIFIKCFSYPRGLGNLQIIREIESLTIQIVTVINKPCVS